MTEQAPVKNYWLSWFGQAGDFELHWPWWISGYRSDYDEDTPTICAAVRAASEDGAKELIFASFDQRPKRLEWRFCDERHESWTPFSDRFPRAGWMQWPVAHGEGADRPKTENVECGPYRSIEQRKRLPNEGQSS